MDATGDYHNRIVTFNKKLNYRSDEEDRELEENIKELQSGKTMFRKRIRRM